MSDVVKMHRAVNNVRVNPLRGIHHAFPSLADIPVQRTPEKVRPSVAPETLPPRTVAHGEDRLEKVSWEDEYNRGFEEGKKTAEETLRTEYEIRLRAERERISAMINGMTAQLAHMYERVEREAFHFSLAVAGRIIDREVKLDDQIVVRQVREAIRRVVGVESIKLRVHPLDEPVVRQERNAVLSSADSVRELIIEADEKVDQGGCIIESASGNVDARRSTQLKQIEAALFGPPSAAAAGEPER